MKPRRGRSGRRSPSQPSLCPGRPRLRQQKRGTPARRRIRTPPGPEASLRSLPHLTNSPAPPRAESPRWGRASHGEHKHHSPWVRDLGRAQPKYRRDMVHRRHAGSQSVRRMPGAAARSRPVATECEREADGADPPDPPFGVGQGPGRRGRVQRQMGSSGALAALQTNDSTGPGKRRGPGAAGPAERVRRWRKPSVQQMSGPPRSAEDGVH